MDTLYQIYSDSLAGVPLFLMTAVAQIHQMIRHTPMITMRMNNLHSGVKMNYIHSQKSVLLKAR